MQIHIRQVAAAAATVIVLAGTAACGGGSGTTSASSGSSSGLLGGAGAPSTKVTDKNPSTSQSSSDDGGDSTVDATLDGVDFCALVDPATLAAIGFPSKGEPTSTLGTGAPDGCSWVQGKNTGLSVHSSIAGLSGFSDGVQEKNFSGFPAEERYGDGGCSIAIQVGVDGLRIDLVDTTEQNPALAGKGCTPAEDIAQKALAKIKK